MPDWNQLLIVYPATGSVFHEGLARRLATARRERSEGTLVCSSAEVRDMDADRIAHMAVAIVSPWECVRGITGKEKFFSRLSAARRRILVLAEAVETKWFTWQFHMPVQYDALFDVGFISQENKLRNFDLPYRFLFNGPTQYEEQTIAQASSSEPERSVPWAFVGHSREGRIRLAAELVEKIDPGGFVFLPNPGFGVREGKGTIGPSGMASVLSKTRYYVWRSHHEFAYYESFRFIEAILSGAVPCKIDSEDTWKQYGIPGVFPSVEALRDRIQSDGFSSMLESAKEFYLSQGRLADHLKQALAVD